ncbi:hypothetical protein [Acidovorax sp.]|uniref:hypothetical protein n=1 Tax=Acidovorax sp. TaxID=1872122 RepID=UPI0026017107|nr:hypothetical protein [Acidovorax sp.]
MHTAVHLHGLAIDLQRDGGAPCCLVGMGRAQRLRNALTCGHVLHDLLARHGRFLGLGMGPQPVLHGGVVQNAALHGGSQWREVRVGNFKFPVELWLQNFLVDEAGNLQQRTSHPRNGRDRKGNRRQYDASYYLARHLEEALGPLGVHACGLSLLSVAHLNLASCQRTHSDPGLANALRWGAARALRYLGWGHMAQVQRDMSNTLTGDRTHGIAPWL